jgi:hypothetical protein
LNRIYRWVSRGGIFARTLIQREAKMRFEKLDIWKRRRQEFRGSGLTRRAFCARHRLKISTLDYWFARIRGRESAAGLVELRLQSIPVVKSCLEVVVAEKYRIEIGHGFDRQLLGELIKALESLG